MMDDPPNIADDAPEDSGGAGGKRADLADARLLRRALGNGWKVPEKLKRLAVLRMGGILRAGKSERGMLAASRTLVSMTSADNASIEAALKVRQAVELEERLAELERLMGGGKPCP